MNPRRHRAEPRDPQRADHELYGAADQRSVAGPRAEGGVEQQGPEGGLGAVAPELLGDPIDLVVRRLGVREEAQHLLGEKAVTDFEDECFVDVQFVGHGFDLSGRRACSLV